MRKKKDLRVIKTHRALINAMSKLLEVQNFSDITVNDLCLEAQVGRSTFYLHFSDKYELLKYWLEYIQFALNSRPGDYESLKTTIDHLISSKLKAIRNLTDNIDHETNNLLCEFMFSLLKPYIKEPGEEDMAKYTALLKFCSGGMLSYILWQISNRASGDSQISNHYFHEMLRELLIWYDGKD